MTFDFWLTFPFAQGGAPAGGIGDGCAGMGTYQLLFMWLPILVVFYLLLIRPQQRERRKREELLKGLKKNDRVLTSSGIYATVFGVDREKNEVSLKVDEATNTKIRVTLGAIERVLVEETSEESSAKQ